MRIHFMSMIRSFLGSISLGVFLFLCIQFTFSNYGDSGSRRIGRSTLNTQEHNSIRTNAINNETNLIVKKPPPTTASLPLDTKRVKPGKPPFSEGVREQTCDGCFQHNFKYLINEPKLCQKYGTVPPVVLILVTTRVSTDMSRQLLRETWLKSLQDYPGRLALAFLLGATDNKTQMESVKKESKIYHDIIQEDFVDSYRNLTLKTVMALKWASTFCGKARYLLKTDEDMFINIPQLLNFLRTSTSINFSQTIVGSCNKEFTDPYRESESKYYVSFEEYQHDKYPPFCSGTAYIMGLELTKQLYKMSPNIPFFPLEDVYLALIMHILGYKVTAHHMFKVWPLSLKWEFFCNCAISVHDVPEDKKRIVWHEFQKQGCHNFIKSDLRVRCPRDHVIVRKRAHGRNAGKNLLVAFMIMFLSLFFFALLFVLLLRHATMV